MKDIVIVGAGKIGSMIAELLGGSGDYAVTVIDRSQQQLDRLETSVAVSTVSLRASSCAADRDNATSYRQIVTPTDAAITTTTATLTAATRRADSQYRFLAIACALLPPGTGKPCGAAPSMYYLPSDSAGAPLRYFLQHSLMWPEPGQNSLQGCPHG